MSNEEQLFPASQIPTPTLSATSYNPWIVIYWLVSDKSVGGTQFFTDTLSRMEALRPLARNAPWFSSDEGKKGSIEAGILADLVVLSHDYFTIPEEEIKEIKSVLTVVGGKIVYGADEFSKFAPRPISASPVWSPVQKV